jgi:hypothetical protein
MLRKKALSEANSKAIFMLCTKYYLLKPNFLYSV